MEGGHVFQKRAMVCIAESVQKIPMAGGMNQRLMLMLAMNIHQQGSQLLQGGQGHHDAGNTADIAPIGPQFPGDRHQTFVGLGPQFPGQRDGACVAGNVENRLHHRPVGTGANQVPIRPAAQGHAQAVHHDGLARAGFAGQHIKALAEFQGKGLNQGDVSDAQFDQHYFLMRLSNF